MSDINIRNVTSNDVSVLHELAKNNYPLDVHTPHTYWVLTKYFSDTCFILEVNGKPQGFLTAMTTPEYVFAWQLGINEEYRGKDFAVLLFDKLVEVAKLKNLYISLTIAPDNRASFKCMKKYCDKRKYKFKRYDECVISMPDSIKDTLDYKGYESVYLISFE